MIKRNRMLLAALAVQCLILAAVYWPASTEAQSRPIIEGLTKDQITAFTVTNGDGYSIRLAKKDGFWVMPEAGDYPTRDGAVNAFLDKVLALKTEQLVAETEGSYRRLKVSDLDFERVVRFETANGVTKGLYIGSTLSPGKTHVRAEESIGAYIAPLESTDGGVHATAWVDPVYFSAPLEQVEAFTIQNAHGKLEFEWTGQTWTLKNAPQGTLLDQSTVRILGRQLSDFRLLRPLGRQNEPNYGMDPPAAIVQLVAKDAQSRLTVHTLHIGARILPTEAGYVMKSGTSPFYVLGPAFAVDPILEAEPSKFVLQPAPTPQPAAP